MSDLFNLSICSKNQEYLALRDDPRHSNLRRVCDKLWKKFEPYADPSFREQFASQIHPRFWEMYLGFVLLEQGFHIVERQKKKGPDLHLVLDRTNIWIEAIAPG